MLAAKRLLPAPVILLRAQTGVHQRRTRCRAGNARVSRSGRSARARDSRALRAAGGYDGEPWLGKPRYLGDEDEDMLPPADLLVATRTDAVRPRIVDRGYLTAAHARIAARRRRLGGAAVGTSRPDRTSNDKGTHTAHMIRTIAVLHRHRGHRDRRAAPAAPTPSASPSKRPRAASPSTSARSGTPPGPAGRAGGGASFDLGVWTVHASSVDANFKNGDFSTPAQIVMTRVGGDVTADRSNGNYKKQIVNLNGHVVMHDTKGDYGGMGGSSSGGNKRSVDADGRQSADRRQSQRVQGHRQRALRARRYRT